MLRSPAGLEDLAVGRQRTAILPEAFHRPVRSRRVLWIAEDAGVQLAGGHLIPGAEVFGGRRAAALGCRGPITKAGEAIADGDRRRVHATGADRQVRAGTDVGASRANAIAPARAAAVNPAAVAPTDHVPVDRDDGTRVLGADGDGLENPRRSRR